MKILNEQEATSLREIQETQGYERIDEGLFTLLTKNDGFYVEVGAGDGIFDSPTRSLEKYGWQGILIESDIERCAHCKVNRPNSAVLNYECVADDYSKVQVKAEQGSREDQFGKIGSETCTLTSILEKYEINKFDLLVLNANGQGANVFKGLDLSHHSPDYILIEDGESKDFFSSLADYNYTLLKTFSNNKGTIMELYQTAEKQLSVTSENDINDNLKWEKLEKAWDIAAKSNASFPGEYVAYYSLDVDGKHFSGERIWEDRWGYIGKMLRDACQGDLKGKRILELGCNLGLLSVWAAREGAICQGYEYEADILEGSRQVASAFGVADRCSWNQADFNRKEDTDKIAGGFDLCTCFSVMNWVRDKNNLIDLLSRQKTVLYEGHDEDEIEIGRLRQAGFAGIEKIADSERGRGVFIARKEKLENKIDWDEFERQYGLKGMPYQVPCVNVGDGTSLERVYFKTEVWKARLSDRKNPAKLASPHEEAQFLKTLKDVPSVCRLKEYIEKQDHTITIMDYFPNIGTLDKVQVPLEFKDKVEKQKHMIIQSVNEAGVLHNDMFDRNFLVNSNYDICLIDFDQAQFAEGRNDYDDGFYFKASKPESISENQINDRSCLNLLTKAWDISARSNASSPGQYVAYYSLDVEGKHFPGERMWEERWGYIGKVLHDACQGDLKGKRILELGCNLGLLSVWSAREGAICHGYEYEADILEGSKHVASAFGVSDRCSWDQADFNSKTATDKIGDDFDLCTCLSVMNWVRDKDNLIDLLSRQKAVLYEGHDEDEIETDRLRQAGFSLIERVIVSERGRGVFWARKTI
jgi:2-polyprenyl-3-methyl-5-hydroxy-6-metoxy-1,4-benzoquinol methylase